MPCARSVPVVNDAQLDAEDSDTDLEEKALTSSDSRQVCACGKARHSASEWQQLSSSSSSSNKQAMTYQPRRTCADPLPTCGAICGESSVPFLTGSHIKMNLRCASFVFASTGKTLNCGAHQCTERCHDSPCAPCTEMVGEFCILYCLLVAKMTDDSFGIVVTFQMSGMCRCARELQQICCADYQLAKRVNGVRFVFFDDLLHVLIHE